MHFKITDFRVTLTGRRYLKDDAFPSIFSWLAASPKKKSPHNRSQSHSIAHDQKPSCSGKNDRNSESDVDQISALLTHIAQLEHATTSQYTSFECKPVWNNKMYGWRLGYQLLHQLRIPNYQTLLDCYNFLNPEENGENNVYITSDELEFPAFPPNASNRGNKPGRLRKLSTLDEVFIVLIRMRLGLFELDLTHRFRVHASTVSRIIYPSSIFCTWNLVTSTFGWTERQ